jgi:hypothetical protein
VGATSGRLGEGRLRIGVFTLFGGRVTLITAGLVVDMGVVGADDLGIFLGGCGEVIGDAVFVLALARDFCLAFSYLC